MTATTRPGTKAAKGQQKAANPKLLAVLGLVAFAFVVHLLMPNLLGSGKSSTLAHLRPLPRHTRVVTKAPSSSAALPTGPAVRDPFAAPPGYAVGAHGG